MSKPTEPKNSETANQSTCLPFLVKVVAAVAASQPCSKCRLLGAPRVSCLVKYGGI